MASREKKLSTSRKQASASPIPAKESVAPTETSSKTSSNKTEQTTSGDVAPKLTAAKSAIPKSTNTKTILGKNISVFGKKVAKNVVRKATGKTLSTNLKVKEKKNIKIKQMAKALLNNGKSNLDVKKTALLQNGVKPKRIRRTKLQLQAEKLRKEQAEKLRKEQNDKPPVLEPMLPLAEIIEKKPIKKRIKKIPISADNSTKKNKVESSNNTLSSIDETIDSILNQIMLEEEQKPSKKTRVRKSKVEPVRDTISETIEDVMNDLSYLIKSEEEKQENAESSKTEVLKQKKISVRKPKSDLLKKKSLKKENIENNLDKDITLDASAKHLIDMLDLSVQKSDKHSLARNNRRHSIEKFQIDITENVNSQASTFNHLPRTITPRFKRVSRVRRSVDASLCVRRYSPYSTRSDTPAQILRNGKHRKMKDALFDGLDAVHKKRKRLCSDFSGSEKSVSKLSGYESDSSFSDMSSFHGAENLDQKEGIVKPELLKKEVSENFQDQILTQDDLNSNKFEDSLKSTISTEEPSLNGIDENYIKSENFTDNNSNLCTEVPISTKTNCEVPALEKNDELSEDNKDEVKVPEKSIILDIMKQTFNDTHPDDQDKRATRSSLKKIKTDDEKSDEVPVSIVTFYGNTCKNEQSESDNLLTKETPLKLEEELENNDTLDCAPDLLLKENDDHLTDDDKNILNTKIESIKEANGSLEDASTKENILQALGLQSLKEAEQAKVKGKDFKNDYTGTLKTVIKLNRCEKKKGRNSLKMTLQKQKPNLLQDTEADAGGTDEEQGQKNFKENASSGWRSHMAQSSDTAGALRKSHYSNRSNMDGSSEHTSDGDTVTTEGDDTGKVLVIPEKASSFSIHPGRLCKDECSYCFGKFGLFDTPCHIAQMKSIDRQNKILQTEKHLTRDSCLCDACYRHVDRKSNTPSYLNKGSKRCNIVAPGPRQNHCHVLGCGVVATNILRRKWLIKMRKSVCQVINIDLDNPGLHSIPICSEHYTALEYLMICAMCKRRLARNHIHYLGPETSDLNAALNEEGIPVKLIDKPVVCKLCRYFASLVLKSPEERLENTHQFFEAYKKRLLHFNDVEVMDETAIEEVIPIPIKDKLEKETIKKKKKILKSSSTSSLPTEENQVDSEKQEQSSQLHSASNSRSESPSDYMVDYNTLIPSIAMECGSDAENTKRDVSVASTSVKKLCGSDSVIKEAVEISKTLKFKNTCDNNNKNSAIAVQRLGSNPCISVRQLFPGEEELGLQGNIEFGNVKEKTPEGWEKCSSLIQYDTDTKLLWHELQKPYGNQSSFLRHLILLEKYFRSGDLILSPNASHHSINYSESVQNRLRAYDNIPLSSYNSQISLSVKKSSSGIITTKDGTPALSIINAANIPKNTPITLSQINNFVPTTINKTRNPGVPPGLISLHPGTSRPAAPPLIKVPVPQKIKIPLTKNWRPNLIPIDPNKKSDKDTKPGYVKVISGGKPYLITREDYHRMCAIKKSYDLKQKRLMESQNSTSGSSLSQSSSILKSIVPRKGLIISKTATITSPKSDNSMSDGVDIENSLEKLDKTVENLESKLAESSTSLMVLPKIPKSLTVIPQTITHKPSQPPSPTLMITAAPKPATSKS